MAENFFVLGQTETAATTLTTLYTVPSNTKAIVSTLMACNKGAATTIRVAIRPAGAGIADAHYVYYDLAVAAADTFAATVGITLDETDVVTVYAASADVSWSLFGTEVDNTTPGITASEVDRLYLTFLATLAAAWTNMPAAETEFGGQQRRLIADLDQYEEVRIIVNKNAVAGAASSQLRGQYSTDSGGSWNAFDGATGPAVAVNFVSGVASSGWVTMAGAAQADVQIRIVGIDGDGALDPSFSIIALEFR